jgi:hypothetical protein
MRMHRVGLVSRFATMRGRRPRVQFFDPAFLGSDRSSADSRVLSGSSVVADVSVAESLVGVVGVVDEAVVVAAEQDTVVEVDVPAV